MAREERAALLLGFATHGYVQGRNLDLVTYDFKSDGGGQSSGPPGKQPSADLPYSAFLSAQMAKSPPQIILASGIRVVQGAQKSIRSTPVIFWRVTDPVGFGFVESLARPGGNFTGFSRAIDKLTVKRLELLHEMLPKARRIAFLFISENEHHKKQAAEVRQAGQGRGLQVIDYALSRDDWSDDRLDDMFARMRKDGVDAFLLPDTNIGGAVVVALAAKYRVPTIHSLANSVTDWGGLAAYSTSAKEELPGAASYAVRILHGERPATLPVQEPAQYELVLNSRAARAMGVSFPQTLVIRATAVIEK
jgi:putative ABC transport system substrate-binding protein